MMKRQPDGTFRNARRAIAVSATVIRARWIEAEVIQLKRMGLSFDSISQQVTRVGRGLAQPIVELPEKLDFPPDYAISKQAVHKAFRRAIAREPSVEAEEFRKLDTGRCEEMFLNRQPGIRKGNPRSIEVGVKVLRHSAQINGYGAPRRHELTCKDGSPLTLVQLLEAVGPIEEED